MADPSKNREKGEGSNRENGEGINRENRGGSNRQGGQRPSGWLLGDLPNPTHGFQGGGRRRSSSVHSRHSPSPPRRQSLGQTHAHGRVSQGGPPELKINSARSTAPSPITSFRPGGPGFGLRSQPADAASPSSLQAGTTPTGGAASPGAVQPEPDPSLGLWGLGREALQQPRREPAWLLLVPPGGHERAPLDLEALLTATQVSNFRKAVNFFERPREVQQIVETQIVSGRAGQEAAEALAGSLQEAVSKRDPVSKEEILQAKVQAVKQFANPHIPNCDPDEPDVRVPRPPTALGIHRPRFDRAWVEALTNPARAAEEAARWMFAERVVVEHASLQLGEFYARLEQATTDAKWLRERLTGRERASRAQRLKDADREFTPQLIIQQRDPVRDAGGSTPSVTGRPLDLAIIYAECVGRVKVTNTRSLLKDPASLCVLPWESLPQIDAFLRLRGLPTLDTPGCYDAFLSPGVFIDGRRTVGGSEWARTANATLVLQRRADCKGRSATALELELTRIRDTVQRWIPLFRAYLGEYADLLGAMAMATPPHIDHAPVGATVDRDFWPADREMPDAALMRGLWGECEEHYGFHMNMALLTSFVAHASKMEVAMDELEMRWTELLTVEERSEEEDFRNLIKEIEPLTHEVERLLCSVADREQAGTCAAEQDREIVELIRRKEAAENKMVVVDPLIYSIWSRHLLEMFRTVVAKRLSEMATLENWDADMPEVTLNFFNVVEKWNDWYIWIRRNPKAMEHLAMLDIDVKVLEMTVTTNRDEHTAEASLQFLANKAAHRVVHPWIAEAASSPQLHYMAHELRRWFECVYDNYGFTIEHSRRYFVPDFDIKSDPLDHYWDGDHRWP